MPADWRAALERMRYDIIRDDPLHGHKELGTEMALEVFLDESGGIRLVATRRRGAVHSEQRRTGAARRFQVFREALDVTTVNYRLQPEEDLRTIIGAMEREAVRMEIGRQER